MIRRLSAVPLFAAAVTWCCIVANAQIATSTGLPKGIYRALVADEKVYCGQFLGNLRKGCRQTFRGALRSREIDVSPTQKGILIELHIQPHCGSLGCKVYIFIERSKGNFAQVLGSDGDVGDLESFTVGKTLTKDHYDIQKTWRDDTLHKYQWDGKRYSDQTPNPD
jgi:hypothetical protein